jgi:glycyl-tRNA synthetase
MKTMPSFQKAIMLLEQFWSNRGCLIWHPHNSQVGAGTMNPATALRVLGPEPWNVAYVEPSIRPDDGRYGVNPNRLQQHYQYQVVLQPAPEDPQEIYLESLAALGIDMRCHDIRFVEDNWEQPAIGAWGLGWEVWLDGQEITQFTYFQQVGGVSLESIAVEITYGIERILIATQNVKGFRDIQWVDNITYGDVNLQSEQEHSRYYFEVADVDRLRELYELYKSEAESALDEGLVLPAYDYALKCSHTFNVLDTRGSIGTTERAVFFGDMRTLVKKIAQSYIEQRQSLDFPLLVQTNAIESGTNSVELPDNPNNSVEYLLEIGVEELPVADLDYAIKQLKEFVPELLIQSRLSYSSVNVNGTPRRLVVIIKDLSPDHTDSAKIVRGPAAKHAYDADGKPTKAAKGFARSQGVAIDELEIHSINDGEYVVATLVEETANLSDVMVKIVPEMIGKLNFPKTMRWMSGENSISFSRPIRWIVSLIDSDVLPFSFAGVMAGRESRGLRSLASAPICISEVAVYSSVMLDHKIILDESERRNIIESTSRKLALAVGGKILDDADLLSEVSNLIESPKVFLGEFDRQYLDIPQEVLMAVMKKHQRYFPILDDEKLMPFFVGVYSADIEDSKLVIQGNEKVISARFADASYFVKADSKRNLQEFRKDLNRLAFQEQLGSMLDKSQRIEQLAVQLAECFMLDADQVATVKRAAYLSKADLATQMVVEMTALQGVIGREYALQSGESKQVAKAIEQHYWPLNIDSNLPESIPAVIVGLADRLDSLVGLLSVGLRPTGATDPFGQRKMALGCVQLLLGKNLDIDLRVVLEMAAQAQPVRTEGVVEQAASFILKRLQGVLRDRGYRHDVLEAVLSVQGHNPHRALKSIEQLTIWIAREDWSKILDSFARCVRIIPEDEELASIDYGLFSSESETDLWEALSNIDPSDTVDDFLSSFTVIIPAVTSFFNEVLVMTDDLDVRSNRIALLSSVSRLANGVVNMSKLDGF